MIVLKKHTLFLKVNKLLYQQEIQSNSQSTAIELVAQPLSSFMSPPSGNNHAKVHISYTNIAIPWQFIYIYFYLVCFFNRMFCLLPVIILHHVKMKRVQPAALGNQICETWLTSTMSLTSLLPRKICLVQRRKKKRSDDMRQLPNKQSLFIVLVRVCWTFVPYFVLLIALSYATKYSVFE